MDKIKNDENIYYDYIRKKITELRLQKNISEYQMSYDLGKSKGYIQSISSGKALPSMEAFIDICHYFDITPYAFFAPAHSSDKLAQALDGLSEKLSPEDMEFIVGLARRLAEKN